MGMAILEDSRPKARIEHTCTLCRFSIQRGEVYRKYAVAHEGRVHHNKEHLDCTSFMSYVCGQKAWEHMGDHLENQVELTGPEQVLARWPALTRQVARALEDSNYKKRWYDEARKSGSAI